MALEKKWIKTSEGKYSFQSDVDETLSLTMHFKNNENKVDVAFNGVIFTIKRTGFWKSTIEITDVSGNIISNIAPEKWYSDSFKMSWQDAVYKIKVRNNPLAEWVIQQDNKDVLAYGLGAANGMVAIKISEQNNNTPLLLHAILWYLFVPIATENTGDNMMFLLMLSA